MKQKKETAFCSNCLKTVDFRCVTKTETAIVRGVKVLAEHTHCFCMECGEEIVVNSILDDNLENSFEAYKKQTGLLAGQEIRSFREQYHLTAVELSTLLGAGEKTITRYENGAIQDPVYDKLLRNLMARGGFYIFLVQNKQTIDPLLCQRLMKQIEASSKRAEICC
jgi:putative zinc finger/helix-turn-helix YgiT family protein